METIRDIIISIAVIAVVTGIYAAIGCIGDEEEERFKKIGEGVLVDNFSGQKYYIDTLLYAKASHRHKDWYFADNEADAIIIEKITGACHSFRDVEAVQDMIDKYGAKKKNIALLVDGLDGYEISTLYARCARNRYRTYASLKIIDSLTVEYLKNGGEDIRTDIKMKAIDRQIHRIMMFDDQKRIATKIYYADDSEEE